MTLKARASTLTPDTAWLASAYDLENVDLSSTNYTPAVACRGFYILGSTGAVKITTLGGNDIVIPSGLATGVPHPIAFTKIFKVGTDATSILAMT